MKFITVAVWSVIYCEILGYIVSQLTGVTYSFLTVAIVTLIIGEISMFAIPTLSGSAAPKKVSTEK